VPGPDSSVGARRSLHVAYVGPVDYASNSAESQRMTGVIRALRVAGDRVSIGSAGWPADAASTEPNDVRVSALGETPLPSWPRWRRVWRGLSWGAATRDWIAGLQPPPDVIVVYGTPAGYLLRLLPLARRLAVPLVLDVVEWYQPAHLPGGRLGPFALANTVSMRLLAPRANGVLAISSFLQDHFEGAGVPTLRVPPLFELAPPARPAGGRHPLRLCYVGSSGQKDRETVVHLTQLPGLLGLDRARLHIDIVGMDRAGARALLGTEADAHLDHECLHFHGRVPAIEARRIVAESDFSVLQRRPERFAQAGFPSKVVESLLLGTPVMANLTSDLHEVLVEGRNARVLGDDTLGSLARAVARVLAEASGGGAFDRDLIAAEARSRFSPVDFATPVHEFLAALTTARSHARRFRRFGRFRR